VYLISLVRSILQRARPCTHKMSTTPVDWSVCQLSCERERREGLGDERFQLLVEEEEEDEEEEEREEEEGKGTRTVYQSSC